MSQITPGYDFQQNEVPTKETLQLMTAGMSITQIDISQISTALIGIKIDQTSPSLPEGWLRMDPAGTLFVTSRWGEVEIYRAGWGGMTTRRYPIQASTGFPQRRSIFILQPLGSMTTTESSVSFAVDTPLGSDLWRGFKPLDTAPSIGVMTTPVPGDHPRFLLWGGGIRDREGQGAFMSNPGAQRFPATPSNELIGNRSIPFSGAYSATTAGDCCGMLSWNYQASSIFWPTLAWNFGNVMRVV
jgi:hypothetical protein